MPKSRRVALRLGFLLLEHKKIKISLVVKGERSEFIQKFSQKNFVPFTTKLIFITLQQANKRKAILPPPARHYTQTQKNMTNFAQRKTSHIFS